VLTSRPAIIISVTLALCGLALADRIPMTMRDFHVPGTQIGDVEAHIFDHSSNCAWCHGDYDYDNEPYSTWNGSLMGQAGRDPLFFAQMTNANQDVENVGYYCLRCHVPMSIVTGHAAQPDGSTLGAADADGVTCHFCHSMVDPIYRAGSSPPEDEPILAGLADVPRYYGNAMFVLDPNGLRRGPYPDALPPHNAIHSPFLRSGDMCGTCHDVGNVAVTRQPDGTYRYNGIDEPSPTSDPHGQFPLERTYTEWKLSAFANGGVDMGGRFGGQGATVVSTCQDCHMPRTTARGCFFGPERSDLARHDFAGSAEWVLQIIGIHYAGDPNVNPENIAAGRAKAISMLRRAASVTLAQHAGTLHVRVFNETGHKLPTGHIEGRRAWVNVRFYDADENLLREFGHYDATTAELDEPSTHVYEMKIGLSDYAAGLTGLPPGETVHMSLADTIVKDTRIPPRGFDPETYAAAGAPAVLADYGPGQYWDDAYFPVPVGAVRVEANVYYQIVTAHYIEALRHGNHTNHWGETLYNLWEQTDKAAPVAMANGAIALSAFVRADANCDHAADGLDVDPFILAMNDPDAYAAAYPDCDRLSADANGDGRVDNFDIDAFVACLLGECP
jgi:hypothetical protein